MPIPLPSRREAQTQGAAGGFDDLGARPQFTACPRTFTHVQGRAVLNSPGLDPSSLAQEPRSLEPKRAEIHSTGVLPTMVRGSRWLPAVTTHRSELSCRKICSLGIEREERCSSAVSVDSSKRSQVSTDKKLFM